MKKILVIASHPDDEVLGCGGTIAKHVFNKDVVDIIFLTNGISSRNYYGKNLKKKIDNRKLSAKRAANILGINKIFFLDFLDNQLDKHSLLEIIKPLEKLVFKISPSRIYTHHYNDLNIDHQITNKAVVTICRPQKKITVKEMLFFEIPSSTEWQISKKSNIFNPNWFEDISLYLSKKVLALEAYKEELVRWPHPRSSKGIRALASWRGASVGCNAAEAFVLGRKI
jgi:LmbE family N-acetylglucosaminyl deacetylase